MNPAPESTSATGGSAGSQAESLDDRTWQPRRGISGTIRVVMAVVPIAASWVAVWAAMTVVAMPTGALARGAWVLLLVAFAVAGMRVAHFATRQLAPLRALYQMSLVFPDAAPSRFTTALRARTGRQLERSADTAPASEQEAAETLVRLLAGLAAHDRLTRGHSERVRAYAVMLGEEIDLSPDALEKLNWAALAHDLGKLEVPHEILNKNGRPTDDEWQILRAHPAAASSFVEPLRPWLGDWIDCATQHHERYDGGGYPAGLAGTDISLAGRIVSIADAFDVMTATRSYKRPFPAEQARAELLQNAGTQFDPGLVRSFIAISLPERSRLAGWVGWLAQVPNMVPAPVAPIAHNIGNLAAAAAVSAASIVAAPIVDRVPDERTLAVERSVVVDDDEPTFTEPAIGTEPEIADPPISDPAPTVTTTTTTEPPASPNAPTTTVAATTTAPVSTTTPSTTVTTSTTTTSTTSTTSTTTTTTTTTTTEPPAVTVANDDAAVVLNVLGQVVAVLANDDFGSSSADAASLTITDAPDRGTASVVGDSIYYTPGVLQTGGTDSLVYEICSLAGSCDQATVVLTLAI